VCPNVKIAFGYILMRPFTYTLITAIKHFGVYVVRGVKGCYLTFFYDAVSRKTVESHLSCEHKGINSGCLFGMCFRERKRKLLMNAKFHITSKKQTEKEIDQNLYALCLATDHSFQAEC